MADNNNVLETIKTHIHTLLDSHASVLWTSARSILEVTEFGVPNKRWGKSLQLMLQADPWGQAGGLFNTDVVIHLAAVVRLSLDSEGRIDRIMKEAREALAAIQRVLEGQHFGTYLPVALHTDVGPTQPEVFETEPMFGFSYLSMSGTHPEVLDTALDFADWDAYATART